MYIYIYNVPLSFSTISSSLSGAAANTWEDILKPRLGNIKEYKAALLNKGIGL